ncbi:hypothetical protein NDU88_005081 [Pleurodeles waltl]|uniref:Uncharacterized protein n=1 Tax=Pleurodeles waltl TaxID=8319 RepID=A0AAV7VIT8_PLEWA|nr:hypothetical protein NDU88_005081 [Pleurodeles waltl]
MLLFSAKLKAVKGGNPQDFEAPQNAYDQTQWKSTKLAHKEAKSKEKDADGEAHTHQMKKLNGQDERQDEG